MVLIKSRAIGAGQTGRMSGQALRWWRSTFQDAEARLGRERATVIASSIKCTLCFNVLHPLSRHLT